MIDYEKVKVKVADVRNIDCCKNLSDEEIKSFLIFLYELALIEVKNNQKINHIK
jgi:hypothetical protein